MTSPNDANENCFLCDAWAYLSSDDMVLNRKRCAGHKGLA